jgi:hypothetical protein
VSAASEKPFQHSLRDRAYTHMWPSCIGGPHMCICSIRPLLLDNLDKDD